MMWIWVAVSFALVVGYAIGYMHRDYLAFKWATQGDEEYP